MKRPYFASRNHSRRFSLAGSTAALKGCATEVTGAALKGCATEVTAAALKGCATEVTAAALKGCATEVTGATLKGCATEMRSPPHVAQAFRPALAATPAPAASANTSAVRNRMATSEVDARRQLNHTRRPRRR